jgi:hypothetical protein
MRPRRLEHLDRPEHVDGRIVRRSVNRDAHVDLGAEVEAELGPRLAEHLGETLSHVALDESHALGQVLALAVGEIVDDRHLVAARQQRLDDMRADEPCAPCDDRPHRLIS